jgi:hypothetical protein
MSPNDTPGYLASHSNFMQMLPRFRQDKQSISEQTPHAGDTLLVIDGGFRLYGCNDQ